MRSIPWNASDRGYSRGIMWLMALVLGLALVGAPHAHAREWSTKTETDPIDEVLRAWAYSAPTAPRREMDFPYRDVRAYLTFGCKSGSEWAHILFVGGLGVVGWDTIKARVRFDDGPPDQATFYERVGSDALHFAYDNWAIEKFLAHDRMLLELIWHSEGAVHFDFDLRGANSGIEHARTKCKQE